MSSLRNGLIGMAVGGLLIAACGGDSGGDGGSGPSGGGQPSQSERNAMAAALDAAAVNAEAAGDVAGTLVLKSASGMIQGGLTVTSVSGVTFSRDGGALARVPGANLAGAGWAFGVEMGMMQTQQEVGVFEGAVVISGTDIAYGFGLVSATPGFSGASFGEIWSGPNAGWVATALTGIGVADTIIGGNCLSSVPAGLGVIECVPVSMRSPGFNITASAPIAFPGNTAAGSNTMAFAPPRLRGASMLVDCQQTTAC